MTVGSFAILLLLSVAILAAGVLGLVKRRRHPTVAAGTPLHGRPASDRRAFATPRLDLRFARIESVPLNGGSMSGTPEALGDRHIAITVGVSFRWPIRTAVVWYQLGTTPGRFDRGGASLHVISSVLCPPGKPLSGNVIIGGHALFAEDGAPHPWAHAHSSLLTPTGRPAPDRAGTPLRRHRGQSPLPA